MGTSRPGDEPGQSAAAGFGIATRAQAGREIILDAGTLTKQRLPGGQVPALSHHKAGATPARDFISNRNLDCDDSNFGGYYNL
jgi:hypothetical protein